MFQSNGLDQKTVDLNLRSNFPVESDIVPITGKTIRNISDITGRVCNIIFLGQSTNQNTLRSAPPSPLNPTNLFNLSIAHPMKRNIYQAQAPLLTSNATMDHHGIPLGDALINQGYCDNVILTNVACGGSYAADYAPGGALVGGNEAGYRPGSMAYRLGLTARVIEYSGLSHLPTVIDWQQGEWDTDGTPTTYENHKLALEKIIAELKLVGLLRTGNVMFVHKCTRPGNPEASRNAIRQAQADVVDGNLVRAGADIDTLGGIYRPDGTHFSGAGGVAQAELKLPLIGNYVINRYA